MKKLEVVGFGKRGGEKFKATVREISPTEIRASYEGWTLVFRLSENGVEANSVGKDSKDDKDGGYKISPAHWRAACEAMRDAADEVERKQRKERLEAARATLKGGIERVRA